MIVLRVDGADERFFERDFDWVLREEIVFQSPANDGMDPAASIARLRA